MHFQSFTATHHHLQMEGKINYSQFNTQGIFHHLAGLWRVTTRTILVNISLIHPGIHVLKIDDIALLSAQCRSSITAVQLLQHSRVATRSPPACERSTTSSSSTPPREDTKLLFRSANRWEAGRCGLSPKTTNRISTRSSCFPPESVWSQSGCWSTCKREVLIVKS